jgi:hypothetical protein
VVYLYVHRYWKRKKHPRETPPARDAGHGGAAPGAAAPGASPDGPRGPYGPAEPAT